MDAVKFVRERARMCKEFNCNNCPVSEARIECASYVEEMEDAEKLVDVVQKWAEDNPYLKPCPFCGATSSVEIAKNPLWHVACYGHKGGCGGRTGYWDNKEKAVEAWNRRAE